MTSGVLVMTSTLSRKIIFFADVWLRCNHVKILLLSTETLVHERTAADMYVRRVKTAGKMERAKEG